MSFEGLLGERETAMPEYMTPESTAGEVLGTRFRQALESNPLTAAIRRENLSTARDVGRLLPADSARARVREAGLLPEKLAHALRDDATEHIRRSTGRERNDHSDRTVRIILRLRRRGKTNNGRQGGRNR